uniref:Glycosyltransferase n=1 Tax=uncultured Thiotrichaceae bacterium TaxID=298394 RepID=A0A6S6UD11_9GAMM|nr:MAG: Unknown protein [uncultured Thiotrichaceae bacterium]
MHIVFLACNKNAKLFRKDPSYIYRCENLGSALRQQGHDVEFIHLKHFRFSSPDVVVFHRPRMSIRLRLLILWLKFKGVMVVAEFDDLVFDLDYAEFSPGVLNNVLSLDKTRGNYARQQDVLGLFDVFTVSTAPLQEHILVLRPERHVIVLSNAVHHTWRQKEVGVGRGVDWSHPTITYLPGTKSHDRDFRVFAKGLAKFLNDYPQVRLQVTGPLQFDLPVRPEQIIRREKVPFSEYHEHIQSAWVNLSPLESTPFTRCKSALKVIEAGAWGKPTLCSPFPDSGRFLGSGAIQVTSDEELYKELVKLLNPEYYASYVEGLRKKTLALADINKVAQQFVDHCAR